MLEEGVSDHRHKRMTVKALPGSAFEVIKTEFFFQLLVSLLANPARLNGGRQGAQVGLRRQIGEIVFLLSRHPVFADEPGLVPWQMLLTLVPDPLRWPVGDPHADCGRCGGPSATRTRTAANRALSFPFVPMRQLMFFHVALASMSSAALDRMSGMGR